MPMKAFKVDVSSISEAKKILKVLTDYDIFQFEHKVKPDYSNTGGLEFFNGEVWEEFEDEEGKDIWDTTLVDTTKLLKDIKEGIKDGKTEIKSGKV